FPRGVCVCRRGARSCVPSAGPHSGARAQGADLMPLVDDAKARNYGILLRLWPLAVLLAIIAVIVLCASFAPVVLQRRATQGLINLVAVVGLYVFVGNSGVLSFGNVAFMAVGAYVSALLTMKPAAKSGFLPDLPAWLATAEWPPFAGALAGGGVAAAMALVVGWPLMRLS